MSPHRFLENLHKEKLESQQRRATLIVRKLTWVTGLLAAGSVRVEEKQNVNLSVILYVVPLIAVVFDLYIIGENYGIKRMGVFVRDRLKYEWEGAWERWLVDKRDPFSHYALPLSTMVVLAGCAGVLWFGHADPRPDLRMLTVWLLGNVLLIRFVFVLGVLRLSSLDQKNRAVVKHPLSRTLAKVLWPEWINLRRKKSTALSRAEPKEETAPPPHHPPPGSLPFRGIRPTAAVPTQARAELDEEEGSLPRPRRAPEA